MSCCYEVYIGMWRYVFTGIGLIMLVSKIYPLLWKNHAGAAQSQGANTRGSKHHVPGSLC